MTRFMFSAALLTVLSLACARLPAIPAAPQGGDVPSGSVLFQDDFSSPFTGWDRFLADGGMMDYDGGGYRFLVNGLNTNFWSTPNQMFSDVRLEVDAGKLAGPDENRIGLICRFTGSDYYFFLISSDGYYGIGIFANQQAVLLGQSEMLFSEHIRTGMAINHLRADCVGERLTFYINGFKTAAAQDAVLASGDIGLLAGTFAQPGVEVIFDNFVALKP